jgi:hypothetical protein
MQAALLADASTCSLSVPDDGAEDDIFGPVGHYCVFGQASKIVTTVFDPSDAWSDAREQSRFAAAIVAHSRTMTRLAQEGVTGTRIAQ